MPILHTILNLLVLTLYVTADIFDIYRTQSSQSLIEKRQVIPSATWGPYVSLGQTTTEYIALSTVYSPGLPPAQTKGSIFLWPGLFDQANRNAGDLVQTVIELHGTAETRTTCGAKAGQWCIRPFVVNYSARPMSSTPAYGKAIDANDRILIEYSKKPGQGGNWTQKITNLSKNNQVMFEYVKGHTTTRWLQLATEYQGGNTGGTASEQNYWNTTVTVKEPESSLGSKFKISGRLESTKPYTKDGGKTWTIDKVTVPAKSPGTEWKPVVRP